MSRRYRKTMSSSSSSSSGGIGFVGLLQILFIGLKLTNYINWPWFWVLFPSILSISIGLLILAIFIALAIIAGVCK